MTQLIKFVQNGKQAFGTLKDGVIPISFGDMFAVARQSMGGV